jgi:hypothetical protein
MKVLATFLTTWDSPSGTTSPPAPVRLPAKRSRKMPWLTSFLEDVTRCPCGGRLTLIAVVTSREG